MIRSAMRRFVGLRQLTLAAAVLTSIALPVLADAATSGASQSQPLVAGVQYVIPPFLDGSKVRTPEVIDTLLLDNAAQRMQAKFILQPTGTDQGVQRLQAGKLDLLLIASSSAQTAQAGKTDLLAIPLGYAVRPMAIMRNDTNIKTWAQLKGRTVCVSEGGRYVGTLAASYGAIEQVHRAPADALLALRIGQCDATVHDDTMLSELIRLPEWKKFSATLPLGAAASLILLVPAAQPQLAQDLKQAVKDWGTQDYLKKLNKQMVRDIAFEVYLDQNVPDCH